MLHVEQHTLCLKFNPFPTLFTNRLELRQFTDSDLQDYYQIWSDAEVMKALDKNPNTLEETKKLVESMDVSLRDGTAIIWLICFKESKKLIGYIGFHRIDITHKRAEIGYALFYNQHRKGLMQEALIEVLKYAFNGINLHSVEANINEINIASRNLLLKNNFVKEAHIKENYFFNGIYLDSVIYSLINPQHAKKQLRST